MIRFWSYKKEYKKFEKNILNLIHKTINRGNIFFGEELKNFEYNFKKKYN